MEQPKRTTPLAKIAALVAVVAVACGVLALWRTPTPTAAVATTLTVDDVLSRAATRFDAPGRGVLHERYQVRGRQPVTVERWSDVAARRLRVVIHDQREQPILDLALDGERLHYAVLSADLMTSTFEHPRVPELLPMLWMLPDGGGLGSFPLLQRGTDGSFIRAARLNGARLLGTTRIDERAAYLLSFRQPEDPLWQEPAQDIVLTIDATTYAVLRASSIGTEARASATTVWQADVLETLTEVPASTFDIGSAPPTRALPDPRQLSFGMFTNMRFDDIPSPYGMMPVPDPLPTYTSLAFLREDSGGIFQVYEGTDATVALITSPPPLPSISLRRLSNRTGDTYWDIVDEQRDVTQVELIRNTDPTHRTRLYVWHADADITARRTLVEEIIGSIRWVKQGEGNEFAERFGEPVPAATGK